MPQVFEMLKDDHRKVEQLFEQYEQSSDSDVALQICEELTVHAAIEEELVYPIIATKVGTGYAREATQEHQQAKQLITQIENGVRNGNDISSLVKELQEGMQHHVQEEESELFPKLEAAVPKVTEGLGPDLEARKESLRAQIAEGRATGQPISTVIYANKPPTNV